jgi:hypothetical protein
MTIAQNDVECDHVIPTGQCLIMPVQLTQCKILDLSSSLRGIY